MPEPIERISLGRTYSLFFFFNVCSAKCLESALHARPGKRPPPAFKQVHGAFPAAQARSDYRGVSAPSLADDHPLQRLIRFGSGL